MKRIIIVGGGITGLAAAHKVLESAPEQPEPVELTLIEASPRVGGIIETSEIQTNQRDGFLIERGPDSFLSEKPEALSLAKRLHIEDRLIETNQNHRRNFIVRNGKLVPVPPGFQLLAPSQLWPFMTSGILSFAGKARMALDLMLPRGNTNGATDESLGQFVRRRLGREALERVAQPMIGGIYTADPEKLSLRATMPRFLEMEREHRSLICALKKQGGDATVKDGSDESGVRYSLFLSFDRGMQVLSDRVADTIANSPLASIRVNTRVESLERGHPTETKPGVWELRTSNNETAETFTADAVCLALPAYVSARLLRDEDEQLATELDQISYASSATVNLAYKREDIPHALDGFGFVVPFIEKRSLVACTFSSVKFAGRAPEGCVLLRAFMGGALQPEIVALEEPDLISRVRNDLRELLGIEQPPLFSEVSKWNKSMPQYHVGHLNRVAQIEERVASLPGLTLAGNAYRGLGLPDCIRSGETAATRLLNQRNNVD